MERSQAELGLMYGHCRFRYNGHSFLYFCHRPQRLHALYYAVGALWAVFLTTLTIHLALCRLGISVVHILVLVNFAIILTATTELSILSFGSCSFALFLFAPNQRQREKEAARACLCVFIFRPHPSFLSLSHPPSRWSLTRCPAKHTWRLQLFSFP